VGFGVTSHVTFSGEFLHYPSEYSNVIETYHSAMNALYDASNTCDLTRPCLTTQVPNYVRALQRVFVRIREILSPDWKFPASIL